jgi:hypothetical protein
MKTIMINVRDSFFSVVVLEIFEGTTRVLKTKIVPSTERGSFPEQGWQKFLAAFQPAGAFKQVVIVLHNANPWAGTGIEFTDGGECWFAHFETKGLEAVRHLTAKKYNVFVVDREDERRQAEAGKRAHHQQRQARQSTCLDFSQWGEAVVNKAAYRRLCLKHHPDCLGGSEETMKLINAVWTARGN